MEINDEILSKILSQPFFKGKVVTGSMVPVIAIGDNIMVDIKAKNLKRFDIIVFVQDGKLICHYLWAMNKFVEPMLMQTRSMGGIKDYPIQESQYVGKVISHHLSLWQKIKILLLNK